MSNKFKDYFFLIYLEDFADKDNEYEIKFKTEVNPPSCIYKKKIEKGKEQQDEILVQIFKFLAEKNGNHSFDFSFAEKDYKILLNNKDKTFIFDPHLMQNTTKKDQNKIGYADKMMYFIDFLKKINETDNLDLLYKDSIKLYSSTANLELLINIFINVYNTNFCKILLDEFSKNNNNEKLFEKEFQSENSEQIINYLDDIYNNKDNLISSKNLDKIDFYGLILSIYNNCFYEKYESKFSKLYQKDKNTLIEVLLKYKKLFNKRINLTKEILNEIISFATTKNFEEFKENIVFYLTDINTFLDVIESNKNNIIGIKNFKPINIIKVENTENIDLRNIVKKIDEILKFSEEKKVLLINFNDEFWDKTVKKFTEKNKENIKLCYQFYLEYEKYGTLANNFLKNEKDRKGSSKGIIINHLDKIICNYIKKARQINNIEIIDLIYNYDIYYKDENYINKRDLDILDRIVLDKIDDDFIQKYEETKFENIFKNDFYNYIMKLTDKIETITDFDNILKLIKIERFEEEIKSYFMKSIKNKYNIIILDTYFENENDNKFLIKSLSNLFYFICFHEKKLDFIEKEGIINSDNIKHKIYIELLNLCKKNKYKELNSFITKYYLKKISDKLNYFIEFLQNLNEEDLNNTIEQIDKNYIIKEEDFFSKEEKSKIKLLYLIFQKKLKFNENNKFIKANIVVLEKIWKNIEDKEITFGNLDNLLELDNKRELVLEKLTLFQLIEGNNNTPEDIYNKLEKYHNNMKKIQSELNNYKELLKIFHQDLKKNSLIDIDKNIEVTNKTYKIFCEKMPEIRMFLDGLKVIINKINNVKDSAIFRELFNKRKESQENDDSIFEKAYSDFEIFRNKIKNENREDFMKDKSIDEDIRLIIENKNESENIENELKNISSMDKRKNDEEQKLKNNLPKYIKDVNSLFQFLSLFDKIKSDILEWKEKCRDLLNQNNQKEIKNIKNIKNILKILKEKGIYDFSIDENNQKKNIYIQLFNLFIDKSQALDFLYTHSQDDIKHLFDKIEPNIKTIEMNDISNTIDCLIYIEELKKKNTLEEIIEYIKSKMNDDNSFQYFKKYSENFGSVIDFNQNFEFSLTIYRKVDDIIRESYFSFHKNKDEFKYKINENNDNNNSEIFENISIEEIRELENKIQIKNLICKSSKDDKLNKYYEKYNKLKFFKDLSYNIEEIYDLMNFLRKKGSTLPIIINIEVKYEKDPNIKYYFDEYTKNKDLKFKDIQKFLLDIKMNLTKQLDKCYKQRSTIRFIYGKQIDNILSHIQGDKSIDSFIRYILNLTDFETDIKEGEKIFGRNTEDCINEFSRYISDSFDIIQNYIFSLFRKNNLSIEQHYRDILIKQKNNNILKGIYKYESKSISTEEDILHIFLDKIGKMPIAQNILTINNETLYEEMESFFHRAILCLYNTLFVVKVNDSSSDYQKRYMNIFIDKILTYKNKKYNENSKNKGKEAKKSDTSLYMDSCLVFVYNNHYDSFLNELKKFKPKEFDFNKESDLSYKDNISSSSKSSFNDPLRKKLLNNTYIVQSEKCGLGKSTYIKNKIKDENKKYIHFPLGGNITKQKIFNDLEKRLEIIKKEKNKNISIHLDLFPISDNSISILNDFLFSILITKFYSNNESIIYIPTNIEIYVEIPNCFTNFLDNFKILYSFMNNDNYKMIKLNEMPELKLSKENKYLFKMMFNLNNNKEINDFIKNIFDSLNIKKYSYHQINILINILISQYSNKGDGKKLNFKTVEKIPMKFLFFNYIFEKEKDLTDECLRNLIKGTKYFINGGFSSLLLNDKGENKDKKDDIDILSEAYEDDINNIKYDQKLIFIPKRKNKDYFLLDISNKALENGEVLYKLDDKKKELRKKQKKKYQANFEKIEFLGVLKEILELENPIEPDGKGLISLLEIVDKDKYVITKDNFRKMILILYRIIAKIPVIIMGETGCGKTSLIKKLNQLKNNGDENMEIINIEPSFTDEKLIEIMDKINIQAKKKVDGDYWVFLDEINTCDSLSLITEIFINRTYDNKNLEKNIRLIGACNPYRKKKKNLKICGLPNPNKDNDLIYLVNILPQSLMYYVFNFSHLKDDYEKEYIKSIISDIILEPELRTATTNIISKCHQHFRRKYDSSVTSLRELIRFKKLYEFFQVYFHKKGTNESCPTIKIKSIIISIYLCYYIREIDKVERTNFEGELKNDFNNLINSFNLSKNDFQKISNLTNFSKILLEEENFIINNIKLEKGIGINKSLKENIFLLFICLVTKIPLIIIGKPGSSKSLSAKLIYKEMKGKYSGSEFFREYPSVIQSYFQGSDSTTPEEVKNIFEIAKGRLKKLEEKNKDPYISMILFDELGLAEKSKYNPLKVLHSYLDYGGNKEGISFVGISNWILDAAKINRALILSVPDLDDNIEDLKSTSQSIAKSIKSRYNDNPTFKDILPEVYFNYKETLRTLKKCTLLKQYELSEYKKALIENKSDEHFQKIFDNCDEECKLFFKDKELQKNANANKIYEYETFKQVKEKLEDFLCKKFIDDDFEKISKNDKTINVDFHGNRDFYYLIKGIANEMNDRNSNSIEIIKKHIERNFGGAEIIIDFEDELHENEKEKYEELFNDIKKQKKLHSEELFKKVYNNYSKSIIISNNDIINYFDNIIDNINDTKSRYLLLEIKPSLSTILHQKILQKLKKKIFLYEGSPFIDDNSKDYQFKIISKIQQHAEENHILILQNLNHVYPFLYDLFNKNFIQKDYKKYARIYHGNFFDQLTPINDSFRIIIIVDKKYLNEVDPPFLSRFEKMKLSFNNIINNENKERVNKIIEQLDVKNFENSINFNVNYRLKDLLIGCKKEDILGILFYETDSDTYNKKDNILDIIFNKISKLLSQDIIVNLNNENILRKKYFEKKRYYNLQNYLKEELNFRISIIYTFNKITDLINGIDESSNIKMISEIRSENQLKIAIDKIISKKEDNISNYENLIFIHFDDSNQKTLGFIITFIQNNYFNSIRIKENEELKFILIVHIKRNFYELIEDNTKKINRIYAVPDINDQIYQLFIDNLNGTNIKLDEILSKPFEQISKEDYEELLWKEIRKFIDNNLKEIYDKDEVITTEKYLEKLEIILEDKKNNNKFKDRFINKIKTHLEKIQNKNSSKNLIKEIYDKKYINKSSIDIITVMLDYIKNEIIIKYIDLIISKLEDNNILTTLVYLCNHKEIIDDKNFDLFVEMAQKYLNKIEMEEDNYNYKPKFYLNFSIPGFYLFYKHLSDFINQNIKEEFFKNEKKIRCFLNGNKKSFLEKYNNKNKELISLTYQEIEKDVFVFEYIKRIPSDIILKDYITFYLNKNIKKSIEDMEFFYEYNLINDGLKYDLIILLLNLRFSNTINENNKTDPYKLLLHKINWIEANNSYIIKIINICGILEKIFKEGQLIENIKKIIETGNLRYITHEKKNPDITKEVNECYYKLLASISYAIIPPYYDLNNKNSFINYLEYLKKAMIIIKSMNDDLYIFSIEVDLLDEFIHIYEVLEINNKLDNYNLYDLCLNLKKSNEILQKNVEIKAEILIDIFENLYDNILRKSLKYYDKGYDKLLKFICFREIKKVPNVTYRAAIFKKILKDKEIIIISNDILHILLFPLVNPLNPDITKNIFHKSIISILNSNDYDVLLIIENILENEQNEIYNALSESLLYNFEKKSLMYFHNILNNKKQILFENDEDEYGPLKIYKNCIKFLNDYKNDIGKIKGKNNKNLCKLFCVGYIRAYCYTFINLYDSCESRLENVSKIINEINNSRSLSEIISFYIWKIIYNKKKKY